MKNNKRIVILGCGISGMITALALARYNISSTIIESDNTTNKEFFNDIRTTAINVVSKKTLRKIGIWNQLSKLCGTINKIYVVDNKASQMIYFSKKFTPKREMGYLIENTKFKKCLYKLIKKNKLITLLENTSYIKIDSNLEYCELILNNNTRLLSNLVIVCDGLNSQAKKSFFSNKIEKDYLQKALTFIVQHEKKHKNTAVEHFMPNGPFAILPLRDPSKSSVVWTVTDEYASVLLKIKKKELTYLVQENFGIFLGKIKIQSKIAVFPLKGYLTERYYNNNIVLVADTAHIIHPLAGQGLNQGIKDIDCLSGLIAKNNINESILSNYQKSRENDNKNMLLITDVINSIFSSHSKLLHIVRQFGFKIIDKNSFLKEMLIKYGMGER